jgi:MFS family permease
MLSSPRATVFLVFVAFGAVVGSHVGALPVIVASADVDPEFFGRTQSFAMLAALVAMLVGGTLSRRFNHRSVMLAALPVCFLALIYALSVGSPSAYLMSNLFLAASLSFVDLNMNAEGSEIEDELKRLVFNTYHAGVSLGFAGAALISSYLSVKVSVMAPAIVATCLVFWAWIEVWRNIANRTPHVHIDTSSKIGLPKWRLSLIGITIGLSNAAEITGMMWAGQLLAALKPELLAYSGLGAAFFGLCGGGMRLWGDHLRSRLGDLRVVTGGLVTATLGFAVIGLQPGFTISVLAFAAVGGGLGFVFPYLFALAGKQAPTQRAAAMGYAAAVSGGPRFIIPWLLGIVATWYSISTVFALAAVLTFATLMMIVFALSQKKASAQADASISRSQI